MLYILKISHTVIFWMDELTFLRSLCTGSSCFFTTMFLDTAFSCWCFFRTYRWSLWTLRSQLMCFLNRLSTRIIYIYIVVYTLFRFFRVLFLNFTIYFKTLYYLGQNFIIKLLFYAFSKLLLPRRWFAVNTIFNRWALCRILLSQWNVIITSSNDLWANHWWRSFSAIQNFIFINFLGTLFLNHTSFGGACTCLFRFLL